MAVILKFQQFSISLLMKTLIVDYTLKQKSRKKINAKVTRVSYV